MTAGLHCRGLAFVLAAVAHAASHDHRAEAPDVDRVSSSGRLLPPLFGWPVTD